MTISPKRYNKARLWITFFPPILLFLAINFGSLPTVYIFVLIRLYLCVLIATFLVHALLFKEFASGWSSVTQAKNPKAYRLCVAMMIIFIIGIVIRTLADLVEF